jgi:hypothetical protein
VPIAIPGVQLIDPAKEEQKEESYVLYGHYNSGKSHLLASAMRYYIDQGKSVLYIVCTSSSLGEDPMMTIGQLGIGECVAKIGSMRDFQTLMKGLQQLALKKQGIDVVGLDSLASLSRLAVDSVAGPGKHPEYEQWTKIHNAYGVAVTAWKECAPISIAVVPADRRADTWANPESKKKNLIVPQLPGQQAGSLIGKVQYLGYLEAEKNEKQIQRRIYFGPEDHCQSRANGLLREIVEPIELDHGPDNWAKIQQVFEEHRKPELTYD